MPQLSTTDLIGTGHDVNNDLEQKSIQTSFTQPRITPIFSTAP